MKFKGFTLAEVLITLAIIGIVAALTIPSVISNYQQQEFKTGLKKAVSVLNEAIQINIAQDGETPYENSNLFNYLQRHTSVLNKLENYYTCYDNDGNFKNSNGETYCGGIGETSNNVFYTADGFRFEVPDFHGSSLPRNLKLHESGLDLIAARFSKTPVGGGQYITTGTFISHCGSYGLANNPNNTTVPPCYIMVDVNGDKKPNYLNGIPTISGSGSVNAATNYTYPSPTDKKLSDIFTIMITDEKAIPFGVVAQRAMYSK